jgi:hypothetical protein
MALTSSPPLTQKQVTSRKNNYSAYRTLLHNASVPIQSAVPFIGATLADLSFLDMGHATFEDTLINFNKQRRVAQVLGTLKKFQVCSSDIVLCFLHFSIYLKAYWPFSSYFSPGRPTIYEFFYFFKRFFFLISTLFTLYFCFKFLVEI